MRTFINGLDINYKIIGEGRPLLILHGWGSNSEKWQRVAELLAERGLKVIIPDLPGFGGSLAPQSAWGLDEYADFVKEFVDFLNLEKFYLLGHSFGGEITVKYSLRFPGKINKLFLVDASCIRTRNLKKKLLYIISKIFKIFSFSPFLRRIFYKFIVGKSDYLSTAGVMRDTYLKIIAEDLSDVISQVQVPTVIIWGNKDNVTPIKDAYLIKEKIQNSRLRQARLPARQGFGGQAKLEIIPGVGHNLHLEAPKELSSLILRELS